MTSPSPLLYNRGVNGENIFVEERNYDLFLRLYEKHLSPVTDLFAYCMLRNHFHVSLRVKSEEEIIETLKVSPVDRVKTLRVSPLNRGKTLKVSSTDSKHNVQGSSASRDDNLYRKPLGFDRLGSHYVSDQFSNFFNAYAKTINKAYERTGSLVVYLSTPSSASRSLLTVSFGT
ncbi:MAG: hypothetical protein MN733_20475 [Nitrososphaera sp.]|nr:hypothetical protein [Nitrososphaera sp.]MCI0610665.1 hypothetical protein [Anaerolineae bacterium]